MIRYLIVVYSLTVYACGPMPESLPKANVAVDTARQVTLNCPTDNTSQCSCLVTDAADPTHWDCHKTGLPGQPAGGSQKLVCGHWCSQCSVWAKEVNDMGEVVWSGAFLERRLEMEQSE